MFRTYKNVVLTAVVLLATAAAVQAAIVHDVTNPAADVTWLGDSGLATGATLTTSASSGNYAGADAATTFGITAYEGVNVFRSIRTAGHVNALASLRLTTVPASGDLVEIAFALYMPDTASYSQFLVSTATNPGGNGGDIATFYFPGGLGGGAQALIYTGGWSQFGTPNLGAWNIVQLTRTGNTGSWTASLNGNTPTSYTLGVNGQTTNPTGAMTSVQFYNANDSPTSTFYVDAIPEPSTIALLATGLIISACGRKRK